MTPSSLALFTTEEMRKLEQRAVAAGTPLLSLMEAAGKAVALEVLARFQPRSTLVLCGPGNNGGDGYVVARCLQEAGWPVVVVSLTPPTSELTRYQSELWKGNTISFPDFTQAQLVIDGLFGFGLNRPLEGVYGEIITELNNHHLPCVAIDIPSGINSDTGEVMGVAIKASLTITFGYFKPGHVLLPGRLHCGEVIIRDIGAGEPDSPSLFVNHPELWRQHFPIPTPLDHKYMRGHGLVFGGTELTGAARLATSAARRIGAGLVTIACSEETYPIYAMSAPGHLTKKISTLEDVTALLSDPRKNAVLIGPGNEPDDFTKACVLEALKAKRRCVLDAGALTVFKNNPQELFDVIQSDCVLTPHEGEFERLFKIKGDKLLRARSAAKVSGAVVVLKGADTIIADPKGIAYVSWNAPPWLATGGTGDVLSGLIMGLLAQGCPTFEAAAMAVWFQGEAANLLGLGLIAEDLPQLIPQIIQTLLRRT